MCLEASDVYQKTIFSIWQKKYEIPYESTWIFSVFDAIFRALSDEMGFRRVKTTETLAK